MLKKIKKFWSKNSQLGQSMVEYILVFAGVVIVLVAATGPSGVMTEKTSTALDTAVTGVECMTNSICYDPAGCPTTCGNGCCEPGETPTSCSQDCRPNTCGDGQCSGTETCSNCVEDCGTCPAVCGDGQCTGGETCSNCEIDCGTCGGCQGCSCGSITVTPPGSCGQSITLPAAVSGSTVSRPCGASCESDTVYYQCLHGVYSHINGSCSAPCIPNTCGPSDCGLISDGCGGFIDCGPCVNCGNGVCDAGETCANCPGDCNCPIVCGNGFCDDMDECATCPGDCSRCEDCDMCSQGCEAVYLDPPGSCSELIFYPDLPVPSSSGGGCPYGCEGDGIFARCTIDGWGIEIGSCEALELGENCGDFDCNISDGEACTNCPFDCGLCPPGCEETSFTFSGCGQVNLPEYPDGSYFWQRPCPGSCSGTYTARCNWGGWSIDTGSCNGIECGDGTCMGPEDCTTCPDDCGECVPCPATQLDATCGTIFLTERAFPGVWCNSCPGSGGSCGGSYCAVCLDGGSWLFTGSCLDRVCGDGNCIFPTENAVNCPQDCVVCGDGICDNGETCESCQQDCECSSQCGNGVCDLDECGTCPGDCLQCADCGLCSPGACDGFLLNPPGTCAEQLYIPSINDGWTIQSSCPWETCEGTVQLTCNNGQWSSPTGSCAPAVVGSNCGDLICDWDDGERCATCPFDCGNCATGCNETTFNFNGCGEVTLPEAIPGVNFYDRNCPGGCSGTYDAFCGNGWGIDSIGSCGGPECGDGVCLFPEDCTTCASDCGACVPCPAVTIPSSCGNFNLPQSNTNQTASGSCPGSCSGSYFAFCVPGGFWALSGGDCVAPNCGDGACVYPPENSVNCPQDCPFF